MSLNAQQEEVLKCILFDQNNIMLESNNTFKNAIWLIENVLWGIKSTEPHLCRKNYSMRKPMRNGPGLP